MEYGDTISIEEPAGSRSVRLQPDPAPEATSRVATLLRRFDDLSDRLSPIVVKEVRQIVCGREFNYSFMVSLVIGLLVAFFGAANASSGSGTTGQGVFTALTACLALLGIGIVPFGAFSALRSERLEQTMDLITVTTLTARKVIVGKLLAQAVKLATLFAGMAPFVATSFLLGGIDFVTIVVSLAMVFLVSLWVCAAALLVSSLAKTRGMSGALLAGGVLVLLLLFGGGTIINRLMFGLARGGVVSIGIPFRADGWWALAIGVTLGALSLVNLMLLAENRLSSPVENKSTALRIGFFVQFLAIIGGFTAVAHFSSLPGAVEPMAVFGLLHLSIVAAFTVTEDFPVSRRVLRHIQTASRWSPLWTILWPGGGRGAAYVLFQMVLLIVAVRLVSTREVGWVVAACGYICLFTGAPAVLLRLVRPRISAFYIRVAILVLLSASLVLPDVLYYIVAQENGFNLLYSTRHLINPLRTIANWSIVEARGLYLMPALVGVMGVLLYARLMVMNRRTSRTAPLS
ncbi:MAG TPA: hypothetical protein VFD21_18800 [Vicinamibacterales bacterium]|nr:hypothetical protein [Vicinamibacterales bacterium]